MVRNSRIESPCPDVLIGTQHPSNQGGVLTLVKTYLHWLREKSNLSPSIAYPTVQYGDPLDANPITFLRGQFKPSLRKERWDGIPATCVGRLFPALESLNGFGNRNLWDRTLESVEMHQVICGYAVTGIPQALSDRKFVAWVATSMDGDKRARLRSFGWLRRVGHALQYRRLLQLERTVLERASWVFALSPYTAEELLERGATRDRLSLLPCPVDTSLFTPATTPPERPTILWAGRHDDARKNTALLIRAFARIARSIPEARLLLTGEATESKLMRIASEANVADRVEVRGYSRPGDLPAVYREASLFAIPSDQEGLCIAGLEAMASGLPVVSTRCGGPEAFVLPGKTGVLINLQAEADLADALYHLLTDHETRSRLGREARTLVEREYSFTRFGQHLGEIYGRIWPGKLIAAQRIEGEPAPANSTPIDRD